MSNTYLWLKAIHLLGVVLFLGNIIVTGWWKVMADRTQNPQIIAFAQRQVTLTDYIFTAGGALILFIAGVANVILHHMDYSAKWLTQGFLMFVLSGIIWAVILIPTQIKQAKMASVFANTNKIPDSYWKLCTRWNVFGAIAVILPLINLYWMTFKTA
ncbi:MAG TPA: DUF2269 family protein [Methylotenera sp.]|nr:DUF2269 family protein [Methylotenera sp.]HPH04572.1 DUF2269 family protein [Methylotenera sp.]HPN00753.1 DUF2269 family protein [Methylotenera sp.]